MDGADKNSFRFGDFSLNVVEKVVRRNGEIIALQPRVIDVLCLLVERRGALVSKEELMETIWAESFVEESNITQSIYSLRRVLGSDNEGKPLIETIPKRGYRLTVDVEAGFDRRAVSAANAIQSEPAKAPDSSRFRYRTAIAVGVAVLVLAALTTFSVSRYLNGKSATPVEKVKFQKLTFSGDITFPVISPDGQSFAFIKDNAIYLQDVSTGSSIKLDIPGHDHFGNIQFSNEGESIYFRNESSYDAAGDIFKVSRFGGTPKLIAERVWSTVGLSPTSDSLAFVRFYPKEGQWTLIVKDLKSGEERILLSRNLPYTIYRRGFPAWSPNGERIAIVEQTPNEMNVSQILLVNAASGDAETLSTPQFIQIEQVGWTPDGRRLLITGRENNRFFQLWEIDLQTRDLRPITNDPNIYRNLSVSADGKRILACQNSLYSHIWTAPADNPQNQTQITFGNLNRDGNEGVSWTPDGRIIYTGRITGNADIWSVRPTDGVRLQLTENSGTKNENPFVTADGRFVYFESTRSGRQHIWRAETNGASPTQITFDENETEFFPTVSPNGEVLYYVQRTPKSNVIWRQSLIDGRREMVTQPGKLSPGRFLSISTDGRFLFFDDVRDEKNLKVSEIVILDTVNGGEPRIITVNSPNARVSSSPDGRSIDYYENSPTAAKFWRQAIDGSGERRLLFELPKARIEHFAWSPDGKTMAIARGRAEFDAILLTGF